MCVCIHVSVFESLFLFYVTGCPVSIVNSLFCDRLQAKVVNTFDGFISNYSDYGL